MKNYSKKLIIMCVMLLAMIGFGTIQNGIVANAATRGQALTKPENGWGRFEENNKNLEFSSGFKFHGSDSSLSGGNRKETVATKDEYIKFAFYGSELRLMDFVYENRTKNSKISFDGGITFESCFAFGSNSGYQALFYEKTGLQKKMHNVIINIPSEPGRYFCLDAMDIDADGYLAPYGQVDTTTSSAVVLNIEPEKSQIHLKETVSANLIIDNIKEIAAEDVRIKYDSTKLKFLGMDEIAGIKLVKSENKDGELRLILASKGVANVANAKKALLKLNFQGIASGDALVDVTKGKVSDGITMEKDLTDAECGKATIKIDDALPQDVNNTGEFTLLDLAIDARHLGEDPKTLTQYNTDQVINGAIDNDDLTKIGEYMLANPNYKFN